MDQYVDCEFVARSFPWVDPQKDMEANRLAIEMGLKTKTQIASELGRTFDELCAERANEIEIEKEYGLYKKENVDERAS